FAVLNTMLMAGRERTRDIGILKALGFSDRSVAGLLVVESLLVCVVGGALGIGLALLSEEATAKMFAGMIPGFEIAPWIMGLGLGVAAAVGLICGLAPARRALSLQPVAALRAEA
ncbi:MAG: ABC transporter permease, partial [Myxococcota bacterium]